MIIAHTFCALIVQWPRKEQKKIRLYAALLTEMNTNENAKLPTMCPCRAVVMLVMKAQKKRNLVKVRGDRFDSCIRRHCGIPWIGQRLNVNMQEGGKVTWECLGSPVESQKRRTVEHRQSIPKIRNKTATATTLTISASIRLQ
jgi:hypothetical protein